MDIIFIFSNVLVLFLLLMIGYILGKKNIVSNTGKKELTKVILYVTLPSTIIMGLQKEYDPNKMIVIAKVIGILALTYAILLFLSKIYSKLYRARDSKKTILMLGSVMSNNVFMGYPIIISLFGNEGFFYAAITSGLVFEIYSWTVCAPLIRKTGSVANNRSFIKNILLSPGIIAICIGLTFFFTSFELPMVFSKTLGMLASATSPMAMLVAGINLANADILPALRKKELYLSSLFKLVLTPLAIYFILKVLNVDGYALIIPVLMFSLPTAANISLFASDYGSDTKTSAELIFVSTFFSLFTLPFILSLITP